MAESKSGCPSLGPAVDDSSSSTSVSQAAMSVQTTKGDSTNWENTGGNIQMDLSGCLGAEGSKRIDWTALLRAPQGDNAPKGKGRSKGHPRESVAKPITVDAEPGAKGGDKGAGCELPWPNCVSEEVRKRVEEFIPPTGYELLPRPKNAYSLVWYTGARVKNKKVNTNGWICLASPSCARKMEIFAFSGSTSNWLRHLESHQMRPERSSKVDATRIETSEHLSKAQSSNGFKMSKHRYRKVMLARVMVKKFLPFDFVVDKDVRHYQASMMQAEDEPTPPLSIANIKHSMLEMYSATKTATTGRLRKMLDKSRSPFVHLNVDKWDDSGSGRSFLRVRAFWLEDWKLNSSNLAIKVYDPSPEILGEASKASDVLLVWLKGVLKEHRLDLTDIYSATSDSGSDIKRLLSVLLPGEWAWCVPHMANRALIEAMGADENPAKSQNKDARDVIKKVKSVVEHFNKSPKMDAKFKDFQEEMIGSAFKFVNDAPHRWLSLVRVLERVISLWRDIRTHYHKNEKGKRFPLQDVETVLPQIFALLYPISEIMKESQALHQWSSGKTLVNMAQLKTELLNLEVSLKVTPLPGIGDGDDPVPGPEFVRHEDLHPVARKTREMLSEALVSRFYARYWDDDAYMIADMALALFPPFKKLKYVDSMRLTYTDRPYNCTSAMAISDKKEKVYARIKQEAISAATRAALSETQEDVGSCGRSSDGERSRGNTQNNPKRRKLTGGKARGREETSKYTGLADSSDEEEAIMPQPPDAQVEAEWKEYMGLKLSLSEVPFEEALQWWGRVGSERFPWLSQVARSVFGHPLTAAAIERDFSLAGQMLSPRRSRLDATYVEIMLYLNLNIDVIPKYIPEIQVKDAFRHLPARLSAIDSLDQSIVDNEEDHPVFCDGAGDEGEAELDT